MLKDVHFPGLGFQDVAAEDQQAEEVQPAREEQADHDHDGHDRRRRRHQHEHATTDHTSAPIATGSSKRPRSNAPSLRSNLPRTAR